MTDKIVVLCTCGSAEEAEPRHKQVFIRTDSSTCIGSGEPCDQGAENAELE